MLRMLAWSGILFVAAGLIGMGVAFAIAPSRSAEADELDRRVDDLERRADLDRRQAVALEQDEARLTQAIARVVRWVDAEATAEELLARLDRIAADQRDARLAAGLLHTLVRIADSPGVIGPRDGRTYLDDLRDPGPELPTADARPQSSTGRSGGQP